MAAASLCELQTQAELARRLGWMKGEPLRKLREAAKETDAVLAGLMKSAKSRREH